MQVSTIQLKSHQANQPIWNKQNKMPKNNRFPKSSQSAPSILCGVDYKDWPLNFVTGYDVWQRRALPTDWPPFLLAFFVPFITEYKQLLYCSLLLMTMENMKAGLKR